jgi:hypothetical protein
VYCSNCPYNFSWARLLRFHCSECPYNFSWAKLLGVCSSDCSCNFFCARLLRVHCSCCLYNFSWSRLLWLAVPTVRTTSPGLGYRWCTVLTVRKNSPGPCYQGCTGPTIYILLLGQATKVLLFRLSSARLLGYMVQAVCTSSPGSDFKWYTVPTVRTTPSRSRYWSYTVST